MCFMQASTRRWGGGVGAGEAVEGGGYGGADTEPVLLKIRQLDAGCVFAHVV